MTEIKEIPLIHYFKKQTDRHPLLFSVISTAIFLILLTLLLVGLNYIFVPYWQYTDDPDDAGESPRYQYFYELPENSLDFLVLGASNSYHSIDPMQVYADSGCTGYDLGGPSQPMSCSYYWLREALKTQSPRVVFVDVGSFAREIPNKERILKSLLPMKFSPLMIRACLDNFTDTDALYSALFPLYEFHSRWESLSKTDITRKNPAPYLIKGSTVRFVSMNKIKAERINLRETKNVTLDGEGKPVVTLDELSLTEETVDYFSRIAELCRKENITLVPVKFPTKNWNERWSGMVREEISRYGLSLWDMTDDSNPAGINWEKDSFDSGRHLNYFGMVKSSKCLSDYLSGMGLTGHRGDEGYGLWEKDLQEYKGWECSEVSSQFRPEEELRDFLTALGANRGKYLILMSGRYDTSEGWDSELTGTMEAMGFSAEFDGHFQESFLGIIDGGDRILELWDPDIIEYDFLFNDDENGEHMIHMESGGVSGDCSVIVDGDEMASGGDGMNFVIIDRKSGRKAAGGFFDPDSVHDFSVEEAWDRENLSPVLKDGEYTAECACPGGYKRSFILSKDPYGRYIIGEPGTGMIYSLPGGENKSGDPVSGEKDLETAPYRWRITYAPDGRYYISSAYNGMLLSGETVGESASLTISEKENEEAAWTLNLKQ